MIVYGGFCRKFIFFEKWGKLLKLNFYMNFLDRELSNEIVIKS